MLVQDTSHTGCPSCHPTNSVKNIEGINNCIITVKTKTKKTPKNTVTETYCGYTRVIGQHKAADTMCRLNVRRLARQSHLNACRSPRDELRQLAVANTLQALVHLISTTDNRITICCRLKLFAHHEHINYYNQRA